MHDTTRSGVPSGRFVLRMDPGLHAALREAAKEAGVSLNEYCVRKLAAPAGDIAGPAADAVERAAALFGDSLVGLVIYGSWARDELAEGSDVDLLVIVDRRVAITRELYRRWDASPLRWDSLPVEPHFVHLPDRAARISSTWAEIALDGVVLFERGGGVSRLLVRLRRKIVAGELVQRRIHGQTYWVEAA